MAKIIGGIASSHSPTIGFARDTNKQNDPAWAPIFEGYKPIQKWLKEKDPDVLLVIYNDHITSFFFDHFNKFLHRLTLPEYRKRFLADEESQFAESDLTKEERDLIRRRDWRAMIHYGVTFFVLEKLGAVVGISNPHIYAAMRGETLEEFQKTRNVSVQYSVAGGENATKLSDFGDR